MDRVLSYFICIEIFPGCGVIGCVTGKGITNGIEYTVVAFDKEKIVLMDIETEGTVEIKHSQMKQLRYAFAVTYCSSQGKTYRTRCRLHDTSHINFLRKTLYMALGRVSDSCLLEIA